MAGCGGRGAAATRPDSSLVTRTPGLDSSASLREMLDTYNKPFTPFTIIDNVHYVGAANVSAFLITTPEGHFLIDGGFAETAPQIISNIRALGFSIRDVRILLNSHAHFDHSGGLAALKAASGARFMASAGDAPLLESGHIGYGPASRVNTAPVKVDRVLNDGDTLTLSGETITVMVTPGHTQGCTSFLMSAMDSDSIPRRVFFHCSTSLGGQTIAPESYPGQVDDFRRTFSRLGAVQVDVFLANHGEFFDLIGKRQRQQTGYPDAFVDPRALRAFNTRSRETFEHELARQAAGDSTARR